tara:strand:- start:2851 stop:3537 length:687 start_codon:yes stop_codon:yes gene_type:complete
MADKQTVVFAHASLQKLIDKKADKPLVEELNNTFKALTDEFTVHIILKSDCPCYIEAVLEWDTNKGGLRFHPKTCDICKDTASHKKANDRAVELFGHAFRGWVETGGEQHLRETVARKLGKPVGEIGIGTSDKESELIEQLNSQRTGMNALASMVHFFLTNEDVAKLDGMTPVLINMAKVFGTIEHRFHLGEDDEINLDDVSDEDVVETATDIINESRESEDGGTHAD